MCGQTPHQPMDAPAGPPVSVKQALAMLDRCLGVLATADAASLTIPEQAQALRGLERAEAMHTAARARILASFATRGGHEDDGLGSPRAWLRWHTNVTTGAAAGAVGWARRLTAHPAVGEALAAGRLSASWARQMCAWSDELPAALRPDADQILVGAATGGAGLRDLAALAREMYERAHADGTGRDTGDDGFGDRYLRLGITFRGAGRTEGDLTPACAAALSAVLEALGRKAGPEDTRTAAQRRHDALEEACRRLIASGMLPGRAAQPTHVNVHMTLSQLRGEPGAPEAEAAWTAQRASEPGWLADPDAQAAACDATLIPTVTGHIDHTVLGAALDHLIDDISAGPGRSPRPPRPPLSPHARRRLRHALLSVATTALSGPAGLAGVLRTRLEGLAASASLPLDTGAPTETIPAHLRRAATARHPHCAFPGCGQPAPTCQIHHVVPRAQGGRTALANLIPLCAFHHLIVIHRWGWAISLNPDTSTTATSPDGRTLRSHSPPALAA